MSKKIFIDCGTHMFQGFKNFASKFNIDESWDCYSFEANPITYELSKGEHLALLNNGFNIVHKNIAISDKDGFIKINHDVAENGTGQGSNILSSPPSVDKLWGHKLEYLDKDVEVPCIDFVGFIKNIYNDGDYILIKMDIEGSEFHVLDAMLNNLDLSIVNDIYVEFHERFFDNQDEYVIKKDLYKKAFLNSGTTIHEWE